MKLTKHQQKKLLNQGAGTGYMFLKINDSTYRILEVNVGRDGKTFYTGGQKLIDRLDEMSVEMDGWFEE